MHGFKPHPMRHAQAALLKIALRHREFTAADLPSQIADGHKHVPGAATGALIAQELLIVVRRIKSPDKAAKGRKLDVLSLAPGKLAAAKTWLRRNGYDADVGTESQLELVGRDSVEP